MMRRDIEEKISLVVTVYNKAPYLKKCLESLRVQSYQNIEIVLIDDGSTDESPEICHSFCRQDDRFRYFRQDNGGQTIARRAGADVARGAWVVFIDADDFVIPEMCEWLMKRQRETGAEIVSPMVQSWRDGRVGAIARNLEGVCTGKEAVCHVIEHRFLRFRFSCSLWSNLYQKQMAQKILREMDPRITFNEDFGCCIAIMLESERIAFLPKVVYYYRQNWDSYSHTHNKSNVLMHKWLLEFLKPRFAAHGIDQETGWILDWIVLRAFLLGGYEFFNDYEGLYPFFCGHRGGRIAVYGAGVIGEEIVTKLTDFKIVGWYDRDWEHYREVGRSVDPPEKIVSCDCEDVIIAIQYPDTSLAVQKELQEILPPRVRVHRIMQDIIDSPYSARKIKELSELNETYTYKPSTDAGQGFIH